MARRAFCSNSAAALFVAMLCPLPGIPDEPKEPSLPGSPKVKWEVARLFGAGKEFKVVKVAEVTDTQVRWLLEANKSLDKEVFKDISDAQFRVRNSNPKAVRDGGTYFATFYDVNDVKVGEPVPIEIQAADGSAIRNCEKAEKVY